jgi:hypothetical protein
VIRKFSSLLLPFLACAATAVALLTAPGVRAAEGESYAGASLGSTHNNQDCASASPCSRNAGGSGKLYAGRLGAPAAVGNAQVSQGLEVSAIRQGSTDGAFAAPGGTQAGSADAKGLAASYVAQARFGDVALQGRLGVATTQGKVQYAGGGNASGSVTAPAAGLGLRYVLTDKLSLRADWDNLPVRYGKNEKTRVQLFTLGLSYQF